MGMGAAALLLLLLALPSVDAAPTFWNGPDGFVYRRPLDVVMPAANPSATGMQIAINLSTSGLVAAGKMQADCDDLRFADGDGVILPHWIETGCNTSLTRVWIKTQSLPSAATTRIYAFYGNSAAPRGSDPNATFLSGIQGESSTCSNSPIAAPFCTIESGPDADGKRNRTAPCGVVLQVSHGYPCNFGSFAGTPADADHVSARLVEYRFLFVPDVTGTWNLGVRGDNYTQVATTFMDDVFTHVHTPYAENYTDQGGMGVTRLASIPLTAGRGAWFSLVGAERTGTEAQVLILGRPGTNGTVVSTSNFPNMVFRRAYPNAAIVSTLGAEELLPSAPQSPSATRGPNIGEITVSWSAPSSNGGSTILGYHVENATSSSGPWELAANVSATTAAISGFAPGETAFFRVAAWTARGLGPWSSVVSATTFDEPAAPPTFTATRQNQSVQLTWTAGADGGKPLTGYRIYSRVGPGELTLFASTTNGANTSFLANGLTNGLTYRWQIAAVNAVGEGDRSIERTARPAGIPYPPPGFALTRGDGYIDLTWSPAFANGEPLDDHRIMSLVSGLPTLVATTGSGANTSFRYNGLTNGQPYQLTVTAHNAVGWGNGPAYLTATPARVPDAPSLHTLSELNHSITLEWSAGADGGETITGYQIERTGASSGSISATSTTATDVGLVNGASYCYRVRAQNAVGFGPYSGSPCGSPYDVPYPPHSIVVTHLNQSAQVAWSPGSENGRPIQHYRVSWCAAPCTSEPLTANTAAAPYTIASLQNGVTYVVQVTAVNARGMSASDGDHSVVPSDRPYPPVASASAGNRSATITWSAAFANGAAVIDYGVYRVPSGGDPQLLATVAASQARTYAHAGLVNGQTYGYAVLARNIDGNSAYSTLVSATPVSVPDPATLMSATRGNARVDLVWAAGDVQGSPLTSVEVWRGLGAGARSKVDTLPGGSTSWADTNVTNGQTYAYNLTVVNAVGRSATSNTLSAKPATVPSAPRSVSANYRDAGASVTFLVPLSNGGEPVLEYEVWAGASPTTLTARTPRGASSPVQIGGLVNGQQYYVGVVAYNVVGGGAMSSPLATVTPARAPDAPLDLVAEAGSRQVRLDWSHGFDGGRPITGHVILQDGVEIAQIGANTSFVVNSLTDGTSYAFGVRARNLVGVGPAADAGATPIGPPGAPTITFVTTGTTGNAISVQWAPPASDGGIPLEYYSLYATDAPGAPWLLATVPAWQTSFSDTLPYGASRIYNVSAFNGREGPWSAGVLGSRLPSPLDPLPETYRDCERPSSGAVVCTQGARAPVDGVAAGARHTCALLADGRVDCWGDDGAGQARDHLGGRPVVALAAGSSHTCALLDTGDVDCWGANANGKATSRLDGDIIALAAGAAHTCFLHSSGGVDCQGANTDGQSASRPTGVSRIAAGAYHTCFLLVDQTVDCQGLDDDGQASAPSIGNVRSLSAGASHTCAVTHANTVHCWGDIAPVPQAIQGQALATASGRAHACALLGDGDVACWGSDRDDQSAGYAGGDAVALALGDSHSCALRADGSLTCWGANAALDHGQGLSYPLAGGLEAPDASDPSPLPLAIAALAIPLHPRRKED